MKQPGKTFKLHTCKTPRIKRVKPEPLHELANTCCSTGACRSVRFWPMDYPQDGLLQLEGSGQVDKEIPVDLFAFSSRGVGVVMAAEHPIHQGEQGVLITQAHGAGCSYHRVVCCWSRPHPNDPHQQCVGLRFESPPAA